jgi:peptidoglycan/LPS O-acetylase OafA/YrhL
LAETKQIIALDGLRFAAAMGVLLFHLGYWDWAKLGPFAGPATAGFGVSMSFAWVGWIGVEVFFVLSGFVIAYSAHGSSAGRFLRHRVIRLYPAALVCASLTAVVLLALARGWSAGYIAGLWLRSISLSPRGPWVDGSYWTLGIEIWFYALICLLLAVKRSEWIGPAMGWIGSASAVYWMMALAHARWAGVLRVNVLAVGPRRGELLNMLSVRYGCYFAVGVFLWLCLYRGCSAARLGVLALSVAGGVAEITVTTTFHSRALGTQFSPVLPVSIWLAVIGLMVLAVKQNEAIHRLTGDGGAAGLRRVGLATYPLYLLHQTIGIHLIGVLRGHLPDWGGWVLTVGLMLALAYVVSAYAEPVLQRGLRRGFQVLETRFGWAD